MENQPTNHDASVRAVLYRRSRAFVRFLRNLADNLSPRLPVILRDDD